MAPLEAPDGSGPVAALAAVRHRWANLIALDAAGRVLSWGDVGGQLDAIAACAGTSSAVVRRSGDDGPELLVVDLSTMEPTGEPIRDPTMMIPEVTCVAGDGGPLIVTASSGLHSDGRAELGVHDVAGGESRHDTLDAIAAVVDRRGRVVTVSAGARRGGEHVRRAGSG